MNLWGICDREEAASSDKKIFLRKGQSLAEAVLMIGVLGLVLIGMQAYVKRGLQGKVRDLTDRIIGNEQAAYSQDTSGLDVNSLNSWSSFSSNVTIKGFKGGGRSLVGDETTIYNYSSTSNSN
jgi:hypothetical protein